MSQVGTKDSGNRGSARETLLVFCVMVFMFGIYSAGYFRGFSVSTKIQKENYEIRQNELMAERARSNDDQRNLERAHKTQIEQMKNYLKRSIAEYNARLKAEAEERKKFQNILDEMNKKTHAENDDLKTKFLNEVRTCASTKSELTAQLSTMQSKYEVLNNENDAHRNKERAHKTQIVQIRNDVDRSIAEYNARLKTEVEERKKLQNILDEMNKKTRAEKDDLKAKFLEEVRTCASVKSELTAQLSTLQSKYEEYGARLDKEAEKKRKLQSLLDTLQSKYDDLKKEYEVLNEYKWAIVMLKGLRERVAPYLSWLIPTH